MLPVVAADGMVTRSRPPQGPDPEKRPGAFRARIEAHQPWQEIQVVFLWPEGAPGALGDGESDRPSITVYSAGRPARSGAAVIVCPGGGYSHLALGHEGLEVMEWLVSNGITAFLLRYRHGPKYLYPAPLDDARRAMRVVRASSRKWGIDPKRIGMLGFSAGGHVASMTGTLLEKRRLFARDPIERVSSRPDFLILAYPLISLALPDSHRGSLQNLLGPRPDPTLRRLLSTNEHVSRRTPPTFLFHTSEDKTVSPLNSVLFYEALHKAGVPAELHIYGQGRHGRGLAADEPLLGTWPQHCLAWLRVRGIL